jgi:hypothetical protein
MSNNIYPCPTCSNFIPGKECKIKNDCGRYQTYAKYQVEHIPDRLIENILARKY